MDFACHEHSCSSSSQLQNATAPGLPTPVATAAERHRKRVGPKALNQTRHPVYKGVRRKNGGGKWVSEVREPNKKSRIWLGTFPSPEAAAVAHDVAALALRGGRAPLNFPDAAARLPHPHSSSHQDIQRAASEAAREFCPVAPSLIRFSQEQKVVINPSNSNSWGKKDDSVDRSRAESSVADGNCWSSCSQSATSASDEPGFVDEEAVLNMPALLDSMAEGLLLTPLAMKKGFNWSQYELDDDDECIELNLWVD